jgi:hypothetical protein
VFTLAEAVRDRLERESWSNAHELLAQLIEAVSVLRIEALLIAGVPRWKLPDPTHVPRPGEKRQEVRVVKPSEFARMAVMG